MPSIKRLTGWLHDDLKHLQYKIFNYKHHNVSDYKERHIIQTEWNNIKYTMESVLNDMDSNMVSNQMLSQNPHKSAKTRSA